MSKPVDLGFIFGFAVLGLLAAAFVTTDASLFNTILIWNLWLLGYHHVISTYTRLLFDGKSRQEHRGLWTWLPVVVIGSVAAVAYLVGFWAITTIYLYWQWWHYTRQSWGVYRVYERKAETPPLNENPRLFQLAFYGLPFWGILWRSSQQHDEFIGIELRSIPVPTYVAHAAGVVACAGVAWLAFSRLKAWRTGRLPVASTLYLASHFFIFSVGYLLTKDITIGWLAINIWHNAQYIGFVWYYNNRRFADGVDPEARVLSRLSQTNMFPLYFLVFVVLTTVIYTTTSLTIAAIVPSLIVFQAVNFHHYIVDSVIWKAKKKPTQETLGLASKGS